MTNTSRGVTGKFGEDMACEYLKKKGYYILARNYREKYGEIDIVAKDQYKTLVFVEVKTMLAKDVQVALVPEDQMSLAKLKKSRRIAQMFAGSHFDLINEKMGWRLDLLAISLNLNGNGEIDKEKSIVTHYENV